MASTSNVKEMNYRVCGCGSGWSGCSECGCCKTCAGEADVRAVEKQNGRIEVL